MPKIASYRDLEIWQKAHGLAKEVLDVCESFNGSMTARAIANQLIHSAISVPANVAEGYGGRIGKELTSFLFNARKSLTETDYWLLLALERGLVEKEKAERLQQGYVELTKMIHALMKSIGGEGRR